MRKDIPVETWKMLGQKLALFHYHLMILDVECSKYLNKKVTEPFWRMDRQMSKVRSDIEAIACGFQTDPKIIREIIDSFYPNIQDKDEDIS